MHNITIAVDAMGSDRAPKAEIEGAILAARQFHVKVLLVGQQDVCARGVGEPSRGAPVCPSRSCMPPRRSACRTRRRAAVRAKRDSSMRVGLRLVREGRAHGFVSAGNTGAAMATAKMVLGALPGVDRPALAAVFPPRFQGRPASCSMWARTSIASRTIWSSSRSWARSIRVTCSATSAREWGCSRSAKKRARATN